MRTTDVEIRLTYPISNVREGRYAELTIRDRRSGRTILTAELEPADLLSLMGNSGAYVPAEILDDRFYAQVGKDYAWGDMEFPPEMVDRAARATTVEMAEFGDLAASQQGWEGHRWSHHNTGWKLIGFKYVDHVEVSK